MYKYSIDVHNIGKRFRKNESGKTEFWALHDVSFSIKPGEIVGMIGENGSGKSTLLKIIADIMTPTEGYIDICGECSSMLELGSGFHTDLTGRENIYLSGAILGLKKKQIDDLFSTIVDFSGIGEFIDMQVKHYSSGMYARLAFAVSAHINAEIVLVDEVLSVGDMEFQKKCFAKIEELAHSGKTVIFVSHDVTVIDVLCPRVLVLSKGKIIYDGKTEDGIELYRKILGCDITT